VGMAFMEEIPGCWPEPTPRGLSDTRGHLARTSSAHIAQLVEHSLGKGEVTGSNPVMSTIFVDTRMGTRPNRNNAGAIFQPVEESI
jgi:hypothetical protein